MGTLPFCWFCEDEFNANGVHSISLERCFDFNDPAKSHEIKRLKCYGLGRSTLLCTTCSVDPLRYLRDCIFKLRNCYKTPQTGTQGSPLEKLLLDIYTSLFEYDEQELIDRADETELLENC